MSEQGIVAMSVFDGMSCLQIALDRLGVKVDRYLASEIDKHAMAVTMDNHPWTEQLGDIQDIRGEDLPHIDIFAGGSPCQGFSFAGKQLNFEDPRSKLFFDFVRLWDAVKKKNPNAYFLLENVRMKKEHLDVISLYMGVEPIKIDSNLVSAQNRVRYYWTNIPGVTQPEDKGILLKDIVHEYAEKHVLKDGFADHMARTGDYRISKGFSKIDGDKAKTLVAMQYANWSGQFRFEELERYIVPFEKTLMILDKEVARGKVGYFRKDSQANRVYYIHDKAVCLTGSSGGGAAKMGQYLFGCITPTRVNKRQKGQRFNTGRKFYTLTAQDAHGILIEGYIRKLTPIECERLQTVPFNYTAIASDAQRYKMLGNGWTVDVIVHILKNATF